MDNEPDPFAPPPEDPPPAPPAPSPLGNAVSGGGRFVVLFDNGAVQRRDDADALIAAGAAREATSRDLQVAGITPEG